MRLVCDRLTNGVSKRNMASFIASATIELVYTVFLLETDVDFVSIGTPCYLTAITQGNIPFIFLSFSLIPPFTLPIPTFSFFPISPPPISNATQFSNYVHMDAQFSSTIQVFIPLVTSFMQLLLMFVLFPFQDFYSSIIHASIQFFLQFLFKDQILFKYYSRFRIHILFYSRSIQVFYSYSIHILYFTTWSFPFTNK